MTSRMAGVRSAGACSSDAAWQALSPPPPATSSAPSSTRNRSAREAPPQEDPSREGRGARSLPRNPRPRQAQGPSRGPAPPPSGQQGREAGAEGQPPVIITRPIFEHDRGRIGALLLQNAD